MSEYRDMVRYFTGVEKKLDEHDARLDGFEAKLVQLEKFAASLDQSQKTINNQIDVFRDSINEEFRRLRAFFKDELRKLGDGLRGAAR